jgi:hypothetical protein
MSDQRIITDADEDVTASAPDTEHDAPNVETEASASGAKPASDAKGAGADLPTWAFGRAGPILEQAGFDPLPADGKRPVVSN